MKRKSAYGNLYLWRGDITTLKTGAIVNAANSAMLGCFFPNHAFIDNAIHTFARVQFRLACAEIMGKQHCPEPTGQANAGYIGFDIIRDLMSRASLINAETSDTDAWKRHSRLSLVGTSDTAIPLFLNQHKE